MCVEEYLEAYIDASKRAKMAAPEEISDSHLHKLLSLHFGFSEFRPLQLDAINSVIGGKDCLLVLPTGGGKSLTFMLPPVALQKTAIVVTPLLALAQDQVDNANDHDIEAASWSSQTSEKQKAALAQELVSTESTLKLLYTTPESLQTERLLDILSTAHAAGRLCMLAVDEAHAVSEWGHDFRASYLLLREFRSKFPGLPCLAVTATATPRVRTSISNYLSLKQPNVLISSFNRPNLTFSVMYKELLLEQVRKDKEQKKLMLVACTCDDDDSDDSDDDGATTHSDPVIEKVINFIKQRPGESGIVYARLRATCDTVAAALCSADIDAASYHAGIDPERRSKVQNDWKTDGYAVVVATIAFGMGIDKADVRYVLHIDAPSSLEGLYQEAGRGGRDGQPAVSIVFSSNEDLKKMQRMEKGERAGSTAAVVRYLQHARCRRQALLAHFSEKRGPCSSKDGEELCDYCASPRAVVSQLQKVEAITKAAASAAEKKSSDKEDEDPYDRVDPGSEDIFINEESKQLENTQTSVEKKTAAVSLPTKRKSVALKPWTFTKVQREAKENSQDVKTDNRIETVEETEAVAAMVVRKRRPVFAPPRRVEH